MHVMQRPMFLTLGGLAVGIGLGLLVLLVFFSPSDSKSESTLQREINLPSPKNDFDYESLASVPTGLVAILALETAAARRLALYELIEHKSGPQIADLLGQSFTISTTKHVSSVQTLLFAALARFDPELAYELVWETERANWDEHLIVVFEEWAGANPRKAMQWATRLSEPWKSKAVRTILQTRQDFSDAQLLELAESFGVRASLKELTFEAQLEEVIDEPKAAFELVLNADILDSRKSELVALITERWIEREDPEDIRSMLSLVHEVFTQEQYQ